MLRPCPIITLVLFLFSGFCLHAQVCADTTGLMKMVDSVLTFRLDVYGEERVLLVKQANLTFENCLVHPRSMLARVDFIEAEYYYNIGANSLSDSLLGDLEMEYGTEISSDTNLLLNVKLMTGSLKNRAGQLDDAIREFEDILGLLSISNEEKYAYVKIEVLNRSGIVLKNKGDYTTSLQKFEQARQVIIRFFPNSLRKISTIIGNEANVYSRQGNHRKSIELCEVALSILDSIGGEQLERPRYLHNIGNQYYQLSKYEEAVYYFTRAIDERRRLGADEDLHQAVSYQIRANCYFSIQQSNYALLDCRKAIKIFMNLGEQRSLRYLSSVLVLVEMLHVNGKSEEAAQIMTEVSPRIDVVLGRIESIIDLANLLDQLGVLFAKLDRLEEAISYHQRSLKILKESDSPNPRLANAYGNLAAAQYQKGELDEGYYNAKQAQVLSKKSPYVDDYLYQGTPVFPFSVRHTSKLALAIYDRDQEPELLRKELAELEFALKVLEELAVASDQFGKGYLSSIGKEYISTAAEIHWRLSEIEEREYHYQRIIQLTDRGLDIFETLESLRFGSSPNPVAARLLQEEKQLKLDLASAYIEWKKMESDPSALPIDLATTSEQYQHLKREMRGLRLSISEQNPSLILNIPPPTDLLEMQASLSNMDEGVISYLVSDSSIFISLVLKNSHHVKKVQRTDSFFHALGDLYQEIIDVKGSGPGQKVDTWASAAHVIYKKLLAPVEELLPSRIYAMIDPVLGSVPLEILLKREVPKDSLYFPQYFPYAIYDHSFAYELNFNSWKKCRDRETSFPPPRNSQIMAPFSKEGSSFSQQGLDGYFDVLKHSADEAHEIGRMTNSIPLLDTEASEGLFKANCENVGLIHLSTHAFMDFGDSRLSGILFCPGINSMEDEVLYLEEIYTLNLNASLVCLSACETQLGQIIKGGGIQSLSRAFLQAGANSVVATLWPIRNKKSKNIMVAFYQGLLDGKDKMTALKDAKLRYLENSSGFSAHPYWWAAPVLNGYAGALR